MSGHIAKLNRRYEALVNKFNEQKKIVILLFENGEISQISKDMIEEKITELTNLALEAENLKGSYSSQIHGTSYYRPDKKAIYQDKEDDLSNKIDSILKEINELKKDLSIRLPIK